MLLPCCLQHTERFLSKRAASEQARQHYLTILKRKALLALADCWLWRQEKALRLYQAEGHMNGYRLLRALGAWRQASACFGRLPS